MNNEQNPQLTIPRVSNLHGKLPQKLIKCTEVVISFCALAKKL